jgi:hypothetical protein
MLLVLAHPLPPHRKTEKEKQLAHGRGGEEVDENPNHTTARKPGPL